MCVCVNLTLIDVSTFNNKIDDEVNAFPDRGSILAASVRIIPYLVLLLRPYLVLSLKFKNSIDSSGNKRSLKQLENQCDTSLLLRYTNISANGVDGKKVHWRCWYYISHHNCQNVVAKCRCCFPIHAGFDF